MSMEGEQLKMQFHSFSGGLTHYQYDAFTADLGDFGKVRAMFSLNENGDIVKLTMAGIDFEKVGAHGQQ